MQINPSHQAPVPTVVSVQGESPARALEAAQQLGLQYGSHQDSAGLLLVVGEASAWLELDGVRVAVQFDSAAMQHRRKGGHNEMLGRAVGLKADRKPRHEFRFVDTTRPRNQKTGEFLGLGYQLRLP